MPQYEYYCNSCLITFIEICKYEEKTKVMCPRCKGYSIKELMTAGVCINKKKGDVDK